MHSKKFSISNAVKFFQQGNTGKVNHFERMDNQWTKRNEIRLKALYQACRKLHTAMNSKRPIEQLAIQMERDNKH
jgi:hypothetical protein